MSMKYIKTFENYKINESEEVELPKTEEIIKQKVEALSEEDKNKAREEILALASKLGLSPEDMTDASKVEAALSKKESELKLESISVNEGIKEWWDKAKNKFYKWLTYTGIGGVVGGLITLAIGGSMQGADTNLADYTGATVHPNTAVIVGGVAMAISLVATIVGMKGQETPVTSGGALTDRQKEIIANRKRKYGR